jgi:hypothetical protein
MMSGPKLVGNQPWSTHTSSRRSLRDEANPVNRRQGFVPNKDDRIHATAPQWKNVREMPPGVVEGSHHHNAPVGLPLSGRDGLKELGQQQCHAIHDGERDIHKMGRYVAVLKNACPRESTCPAGAEGSH